MEYVMRTYNADDEIDITILDEKYKTERAEFEKLKNGLQGTVNALAQLSVYRLCERVNKKEYWDSWAYHKNTNKPYPSHSHECEDQDHLIVTPAFGVSSKQEFFVELIIKDRNSQLIGSTEISIPIEE